MLVGAIITAVVSAALAGMVWLIADLPLDEHHDEHADPDNFGV